MRNPIAVLAGKWRGWSKGQRGLALLVAAALGLAVVGNRSRTPRQQGVSAYPPLTLHLPATATVPSEGNIYENDQKQLATGLLSDELIDKEQEASRNVGRRNDPLIAHRAELAVATKEFSRSRTSLEEILERHRGYAARLRMVGQKGGSVLNATLRVPSTELTETVGELKALGDVEREEQAADEVTEQRADLEARLANAQKKVQRLHGMLGKQTYPDGNVRELERQIAAASAEVARLESERQDSERRLIFANVFFTLREEVQKPSESLGAQLRSAAAAGFGEALASLTGLLAFLIGRGPLVALWCAILWLPARFVWKKWAPIPAAVVPGN